MRKAQCTLELTLSFIVIVMLFLGMIQVFAWASRCLVVRHNQYLHNFSSTYNNPNEFYTPPEADLVPDLIPTQRR